MLWGNSPYGQPITGQSEEIMMLNYDDVLKFYRIHYNPNRAILVLSGDIDAATARKLAEKYYGKLKNLPVKRGYKDNKAVTENIHQTLTMRLPNIAAPRVMRQFLLPPSRKLKNMIYAYDILAEFLGGGETAELYRDLVLRQRFAVSVGASYSYMTRSNTTFGISMMPDTEIKATPEDYAKVLNKALERAQRALTNERLEQIKRKMSANLVYLNDNPQTAANWIGYMLSMGFSLEDVQNYEDNIQKVTLEEVKQAFSDLLSASDITAVLLPSDDAAKGGKND